MTLYDILEIENTPEILQFTYSGTDELLWPCIRSTALRLVIDREVFGRETVVKSNKKGQQYRLQKLTCLADGLIHDVRLFNRRADIVFFGSGISNIKIDGKYFNRVSDYFALSYVDSTLLIEDPHERQHLRPRANPNVVYHLPLRAIALLAAKSPFNRVDEKPILDFIEFVDARLKAILDFQLTESQRNLLRRYLEKHCASLGAQRAVYELLYKSIRPKVVFFEEGSYGTMGHVIRLAKQMGIKTAEMQHGLISAGHDAYNYAPTIRESDLYREYLPDFFLTYGQWWSNQINLPVETIAIGNPHYEVSRRRVADKSIQPKTTILLLSSGLSLEQYYEMACILRKRIPQQYTLLFRPHPTERRAALEQYGQNRDGIVIDEQDDLYARLADSYAVIGEISTALFEAVGLVDKIFSQSSRLTSFGLPDCPFEQFEMVDELAENLIGGYHGIVSPDLATVMWARGWEANYKDFIERRVGLDI